jgi:hypothetical protein
MPTVKLTHFVVPGADNSVPSEGFEVRESDLPQFHEGDFLLDLEELGADVQVVVEEELDFDPFDLEAHPW